MSRILVIFEFFSVSQSLQFKISEKNELQKQKEELQRKTARLEQVSEGKMQEIESFERELRGKKGESSSMENFFKVKAVEEDSLFKAKRDLERKVEKSKEELEQLRKVTQVFIEQRVSIQKSHLDKEESLIVEKQSKKEEVRMAFECHFKCPFDNQISEEMAQLSLKENQEAFCRNSLSKTRMKST